MTRILQELKEQEKKMNLMHQKDEEAKISQRIKELREEENRLKRKMNINDEHDNQFMPPPLPVDTNDTNVMPNPSTPATGVHGNEFNPYQNNKTDQSLSENESKIIIEALKRKYMAYDTDGNIIRNKNFANGLWETFLINDPLLKYKGFYTESGAGDGGYDVFAMKDGDEIVGLRIDFAGDIDEEDE